MIVAAHALGLGALWRTGAAAYDAHIKAALGLRADDCIVALLYIGEVATPGMAKVSDPTGVVEVWDGPLHK